MERRQDREFKRNSQIVKEVDTLDNYLIVNTEPAFAELRSAVKPLEREKSRRRMEEGEAVGAYPKGSG